MSRAGYAYTDKSTREAEKAVAEAFLTQCPDHTFEPDDCFGLWSEFYLGTKRDKDTDNMLKLVKDALNGVAWRDDKLVVWEYGQKVIGVGKESARTELYFYRATP